LNDKCVFKFGDEQELNLPEANRDFIFIERLDIKSELENIKECVEEDLKKINVYVKTKLSDDNLFELNKLDNILNEFIENKFKAKPLVI